MMIPLRLAQKTRLRVQQLQLTHQTLATAALQQWGHMKFTQAIPLLRQVTAGALRLGMAVTLGPWWAYTN
jgi:hypothetical protein